MNEGFKVKPYQKPKSFQKQNTVEKPKIDIDCPSCKQQNCNELKEGFFCREFSMN